MITEALPMGRPSELITKPATLPRSVVGVDVTTVEDRVNPSIKGTMIAVTTPIQLVRIMVNVVTIYVVCITSVNKAMGFLSCSATPVISFGILVSAISEVSAIVPIRPT